MGVERIGGKWALRRTGQEKLPFAQRLARIEGQIRGLRQMIEDDRPCSDELQQANAIIAAMREVALLLISQQVSAQLGNLNQGPVDSPEVLDLVELLRTTYRLQ